MRGSGKTWRILGHAPGRHGRVMLLVLVAVALSACGGESKATSDSGGGGSGGSGASSCGCVDDTLSWNYDGGFTAWETSTLEPCHTFTHVRFQLQAANKMCSDPIETCDDIVRPGDVRGALADPDVVAAFANSPALFGYDTRPVDGQVFQIHLDARLIEVGQECNGAADCIDEPPGVLALRTLLYTLTTQILARRPCSGVF